MISKIIIGNVGSQQNFLSEVNMNFTLDIFIKETDLKAINITEVLVEWGDEIFSKTPQEYKYKSSLFFERNIDIEYYKKHYKNLMGNEFNIDNYLSLRLLGNHMSNLDMLINMHSERIPENPVIEFMNKLIKLRSFAIFIEDEDDELINKKYVIHSYNEMINAICYNLNWNVSQGVLIIKKD